jgi:hypothetical protein
MPVFILLITDDGKWLCGTYRGIVSISIETHAKKSAHDIFVALDHGDVE